jgi:hypothetical protein
MQDVINTIQRDERDGFDITVSIVADTDSSPRDFESYSEEDIQRWNEGDWQYVGVVVTASRNGHELGSASLWGVDYGLSPSGERPGSEAAPDSYSYAEVDVAAELEPEAVANAWENIDRLIEAAAALT